jgi:peptidoglycan L-alanyl-D-glutamate endopeptidase CwlK
MSFTLTERDLKRLEGVDPKLARVVKRAADLSPTAFMVVEGVRSDEQCRINFGKGRSPRDCIIAGIATTYARPNLAKVTWLRNPYSSRHRKHADGFGKAVDLLPAPYDWKNPKDFDALADTMFKAAKELGVHLRYGGDWDQDGIRREKGETDSPHFEISDP